MKQTRLRALSQRIFRTFYLDKNFDEFASTAVQPHALFDADAAEAIRHSALKTFAQAVFAASTEVRTLADASRKLFDAAVNRKVDGTFTDMTQYKPGHLVNSLKLRIHKMNKLIAALVAGLFATAAFAQASAPEAASAAPAAAASSAKKTTKHHAKKKSHKKAAAAAAASAASE